MAGRSGKVTDFGNSANCENFEKSGKSEKPCNSGQFEKMEKPCNFGKIGKSGTSGTSGNLGSSGSLEGRATYELYKL